MAHSEHTGAEQWATLDDWLKALAEHLDLDELEVPIAELLDAARVIAHGVARPAAPLSAFLIGLAAARTGGSPEAARDAASRAKELAAEWSDTPEN